MLEFIKALSDVEVCGESDLRLWDEFVVVGLYAGVCVRFASTDPVVHENKCDCKNWECSQTVKRTFRLTR